MTTIDQKIAEIIQRELSVTIGNDTWPFGNLLLCVIALLLSVILCGMIGVEREKRGRSAGLRTHLLVGVGSCMIMIISIYGFQEAFSDHRDVARLAAQVITGVGFLGAGAIMHRNSGIKGLTTAGTIWAVMAIGLACGSFNFILAIAGTVLVFLILIFFRKVEIRVNKHNPMIILTAPSGVPILDKVLTISKQFDCTIHGVSTELIENSGGKEVQLTFQAIFESTEDRVVEYVSTIEKETKATSIVLLGHR